MKKLFIALGIGLLTLMIMTAIFVMTVDTNKYRDDLADALGKQTGRMIKFGGPIHVGLSWRGVTLDIRDSAIGNPFWASRKTMAGIGRFQLGVSLLPLFSRQIVVTRLDISNADIQLETDKNGRHNWDMIPTERQDPEAAKKDIAQGRPVSVHITRIGVSDSQLTVRDQDGDTSIFKVKTMSIGVQGAGGALRFSGEYNGAPLLLTLNTGAQDLLVPTGAWPFDASLTYANYTLTAKGKADMDVKQAIVSPYELNAGHSTLHGKLAVNWKGDIPSVQGSLLGERIDPADFAPQGIQRTDEEEENRQSAAEASKHLFSDAPFDLEGLKAVDANLDVKIDELVFPSDALKKISAKLDLSKGAMSLDPFEAMVGSGLVKGQIKLNVNPNPPHLVMALNAPDIRLEDLLLLLNAPAFLSGHASASMNLATSGGSVHGMAANTVGVMEITSAGGNVSSRAAGSIASGLMDLFAPTGSNALNCLAVRFAIKDGIARDNGILVDTGATTISGEGGFNLGRESIALTLHAKTKQVNVGDFMPPLRVDGTFMDPGFTIDPSEAMQNVAGIFTGNPMGGDVPDVVARPGQNACVYTLDHPAAATQKTALPSSITGKLGAGLNALKGILGQ